MYGGGLESLILYSISLGDPISFETEYGRNLHNQIYVKMSLIIIIIK